MNYYDVLGVSRNASNEEIAAAFKKLVRELHPDRFNDEEERKEAEKRFKQITQAFNILRDPMKRREYDKTLSEQSSNVKKEPAISSEEYFKKGVYLYKNSDYENAEIFLQSSVSKGMQTADAYFFLALTQMNLPRRSKKVVENLEQAINLDPLNARYRLALADFLLKKGVTKKAVYHYKRVLKLEPKNKRALEVLKSLGLIKEKGFLHKLFGGFFKRG